MQPSKLTAKTVTILTESISVGMTRHRACERAGISYEAFRQWLHKGADPNTPDPVYEHLLDLILKAEAECEYTILKDMEESRSNGEWRAGIYVLRHRLQYEDNTGDSDDGEQHAAIAVINNINIDAI